MVFSTVKEFINDNEMAVNNVVRVLGYYEVGDGGDAEYIIKDIKSGEPSLEEYHIELINGLKAFLIEPQTINYRMFGAKGDGIQDDAIQISKAHDYANVRNIPVVNRKGEFWIRGIEKIIIQTDVDWGNTIFHIDEKYNSLTDFRFEITSKNNPQDIKLSLNEKEEFLSFLNSGKTIIPVLETYKNHLVVIADSGDRIGFRAGASYRGQSWAKEDLFYIEESGKVIGDVTWTFKDYTKLIAYPVDKNYLHLQGGIFYLSGDNPSSKSGYYKNGIQIKRSKTIITNQWIGLEPGKEDTTTTSPRNGFYSFSNVYDISLENVRLIPYLYSRKSGKNVHSGTYGISMGRVLKSHFKNVTAEGNQNHWGVFGTNLNKDFKIENCHLNRVDIHFHCWNLSILNSHIGQRGITVTGGGNLLIDNTSCSGSSFINFRSDYGSKWDGDIIITNSIFKVGSNIDNVSVLNFSPRDFDYKYPIRFGKNIRIENFKIDFNGVENKEATCWGMRIPQFSVMKHGERISFPNFVKFENIEVIGREKGIKLLSIADQGGYKVDRIGGYKNGVINPNVYLNFINIELEDLSEEENQYHFAMQITGKALNDYSLYPIVTFSQCSNIAVQNNGYIANVFFEKCSIANISGNEDTPLVGRFVFTNCEFNPTIKNENGNIFSLYSTSGTFFSNCIVNPPFYSGEERIDLLDKIGFIKLNKEIEFNHSNTILNKKIIEFYKGKIDSCFLLKLKGISHTPLNTNYIKPNPDFHLYLLIGQSNMAGRGKIDSLSTPNNPRLLMLSKDNEWIIAKDPLHFDKPGIVGVGPGLAFGQKMLTFEKNKNVRIGLIPCAVGGTTIEMWQQGKDAYDGKYHPYDDAVERLHIAMKEGYIKGIIWHQGEGDSNKEKAKVYIEKLQKLIDMFRNEIGDQSIPFVAGELGHYRENYLLINNELKKLPNIVTYSEVATSEELTHNGDGTHLDSKSARGLGERMAIKMHEVQSIKQKIISK